MSLPVFRMVIFPAHTEHKGRFIYLVVKNLNSEARAGAPCNVARRGCIHGKLGKNPEKIRFVPVVLGFPSPKLAKISAPALRIFLVSFRARGT